MNTMSINVENLVVGAHVDLESCPYLNKHPSAESEYAIVAHVKRETAGSVVIGYEGIDHVGYPVGTRLLVRAPKAVPDKAIRVRPVGQGGEWAEWPMCLNLTDREGNLNYHGESEKPLEVLEADNELLDRLCAQLTDSITFIVRKDGQFGILYEVEYCSQESEEDTKEHDAEWYAVLSPHSEVVKALLEGMVPLVERFPGVLFAVPDEQVVINDRPAAWAFVADGLLSEDQRHALAQALMEL